ncbi:MAG: PilN domain-containing protein [Puniceicoccales bacterium]|nr:PilN domain-containing protein [Puniceicoccales bacterium]
MAISPSNTSSPPVVFPAPGWLFFSEILPLGDIPAGSIEDTVLLSLESHSPLPVEQLAYGWRLDSAKKTVIYYAGARDRLRQISNGVYEGAGHVIPDFMLAPKGKAGEWQWIATPWALTAIRYSDTGNLPLEVRSWNILQGGSTDWAERAESERMIRNQGLEGSHAHGTLLWEDASYASSRRIIATWRAKGGKPQTVSLPEDSVWSSDVRERHWLAQTKKARSYTQLFNRITVFSLFALLLVVGAGAALFLHKEDLKKETDRLAGREAAVEAINSKVELVVRLDQLEAGQVSFFDALATMNHFRPSEILFSSASIDGNRQVQVNGTAATISQINSYVEALRNSGFFKQVDLPRVNTTGGRTSFEIRAGVGTLAVTRGSVEEEQENTMVGANAGQPPMTPLAVSTAGGELAKSQQEAIFADARNLAASHGVSLKDITLENGVLQLQVSNESMNAENMSKFVETVRAMAETKGVSQVTIQAPQITINSADGNAAIQGMELVISTGTSTGTTSISAGQVTSNP